MKHRYKFNLISPVFINSLFLKIFRQKIWVKSAFIFLFLLMECTSLFGYGKKGDIMNNSLVASSGEIESILNHLKKYQILFGHHSVGENILDGFEKIVSQAGETYNIAAINSVQEFDSVHMVHFSPGKNRDPFSKVDGFVEQVTKLPAGFIPDLAFLKFCYIDFVPDTRVEELIIYYKNKIDLLKKEYPETRFIHFTVPLTVQPADFKSRVKRLLGLQVWGDASNISRAKFNDLLFRIFHRDPVFDLARIESIRQDGTSVGFEYKGTFYPSMAPEYSDDGGHLNALCRQIVATELIIFLKNLTVSKM